MKSLNLDPTNGLSEETLARIRKHADGTGELRTRVLQCHYCRHKAIIVYEDARGHVETKCKKCGQKSVYNVVLRRSGSISFRRVMV